MPRLGVGQSGRSGGDGGGTKGASGRPSAPLPTKWGSERPRGGGAAGPKSGGGGGGGASRGRRGPGPPANYATIGRGWRGGSKEISVAASDWGPWYGEDEGAWGGSNAAAASSGSVGLRPWGGSRGRGRHAAAAAAANHTDTERHPSLAHRREFSSHSPLPARDGWADPSGGAGGHSKRLDVAARGEKGGRGGSDAFRRPSNAPSDPLLLHGTQTERMKVTRYSVDQLKSIGRSPQSNKKLVHLNPLIDKTNSSSRRRRVESADSTNYRRPSSSAGQRHSVGAHTSFNRGGESGGIVSPGRVERGELREGKGSSRRGSTGLMWLQRVETTNSTGADSATLSPPLSGEANTASCSPESGKLGKSQVEGSASRQMCRDAKMSEDKQTLEGDVRSLYRSRMEENSRDCVYPLSASRTKDTIRGEFRGPTGRYDEDEFAQTADDLWDAPQAADGDIEIFTLGDIRAAEAAMTGQRKHRSPAGGPEAWTPDEPPPPPQKLGSTLSMFAEAAVDESYRPEGEENEGQSRFAHLFREKAEARGTDAHVLAPAASNVPSVRAPNSSAATASSVMTANAKSFTPMAQQLANATSDHQRLLLQETFKSMTDGNRHLNPQKGQPLGVVPPSIDSSSFGGPSTPSGTVRPPYPDGLPSGVTLPGAFARGPFGVPGGVGMAQGGGASQTDARKHLLGLLGLSTGTSLEKNPVVGPTAMGALRPPPTLPSGRGSSTFGPRGALGGAPAPVSPTHWGGPPRPPPQPTPATGDFDGGMMGSNLGEARPTPIIQNLKQLLVQIQRNQEKLTPELRSYLIRLLQSPHLLLENSPQALSTQLQLKRIQELHAEAQAQQMTVSDGQSQLNQTMASPSMSCGLGGIPLPPVPQPSGPRPEAAPRTTATNTTNAAPQPSAADIQRILQLMATSGAGNPNAPRLQQVQDIQRIIQLQKQQQQQQAQRMNAVANPLGNSQNLRLPHPIVPSSFQGSTEASSPTPFLGTIGGTSDPPPASAPTPPINTAMVAELFRRLQNRPREGSAEAVTSAAPLPLPTFPLNSPSAAGAAHPQVPAPSQMYSAAAANPAATASGAPLPSGISSSLTPEQVRTLVQLVRLRQQQQQQQQRLQQQQPRTSSPVPSATGPNSRTNSTVPSPTYHLDTTPSTLPSLSTAMATHNSSLSVASLSSQQGSSTLPASSSVVTSDAPSPSTLTTASSSVNNNNNTNVAAPGGTVSPRVDNFLPPPSVSVPTTTTATPPRGSPLPSAVGATLPADLLIQRAMALAASTSSVMTSTPAATSFNPTSETAGTEELFQPE